MPRKNIPVSFDSWLGKIIDDETSTYGGRPTVAAWTGNSVQSINRRARGEVPYLAREVEIIAERVGVPTADIVERALRGYGGIDKLIAEYLSEAPATVDPADNVTYIGKKQTPATVAASKRPEEE